MSFPMPLRKFRLALGLTTVEAGKVANVTRKTWEAWEAAEAVGKPAPISAVELVYAKLERICATQHELAPDVPRPEIVPLFSLVGHRTRLQELPIDAVAADHFLGVEPGAEPGTAIMKSLSLAWGTGRPTVHRVTYVVADNPQVETFAARNTPVV